MPRKGWLLLCTLALFAVAVAVRRATMINGMSLDGDECQLVNLVTTNDWSTLFTAIRDDSNPPLMYVAAKLWSSAFGTSDAAFKWLALLISSAIPPVLFLAIQPRLGWAAALVASGLCCFAPPLIDITPKIRPYGAVVLLEILSCVLLARLLREPESRKAQLGYAASIAAIVYCHLSGIIIPLAQALAILVTRWHDVKVLRAFAIAGCIAALMALPLAEPVWYGISTQAQPWKVGLPAHLYFTVVTTCATNLLEPSICTLNLSNVLLALIVFWLVACSAIFMRSTIMKKYPDFEYDVWVGTFLALVVVELPFALNIFRPAYFIQIVVPFLVTFVGCSSARLSGAKLKTIGLLLPAIAMSFLWIPELRAMHQHQRDSMRDVFAAINDDESTPLDKRFVIATHGWYAPPAYRYLSANTEFVGYPEVEPVKVNRWANVLKRVNDNDNFERLLKLTNANLNQGYAIYHVYVPFDESDHPWIKPHKLYAEKLEAWLDKNARRTGEWRRECFQAPGYNDMVRITKYEQRKANQAD